MEHCSSVPGYFKWGSACKDLAYLTTLSGYIHWQMTGEKVIGVGDASGMFPISSKTKDYDEAMVKKFNALIAAKNFGWKLEDVLPQVKLAGENAGFLTEEGLKDWMSAAIFRLERLSLRRKETQAPE